MKEQARSCSNLRRVTSAAYLLQCPSKWTGLCTSSCSALLTSRTGTMPKESSMCFQLLLRAQLRADFVRYPLHCHGGQKVKCRPPTSTILKCSQKASDAHETQSGRTGIRCIPWTDEHGPQQAENLCEPRLKGVITATRLQRCVIRFGWAFARHIGSQIATAILHFSSQAATTELKPGAKP